MESSEGDELRADAWFPRALPVLLNNVERLVSSSPERQRATQCIFPECGSGFSEWHVVRLLQEACGVRLSEVVMMDARMQVQGRWLDVWATLAVRTGVRLVALSSYEQLREWTDTQGATAQSSLVLYINGSIRFSPSTCPLPCPPERSQAAAVQFWRWCHVHALNAPTNFLHGSPQAPCACTTWLSLAEQHELT